ncbi:MAG: hypothetical protein ABIN91_06935 [Mucilaginibacter sp.]|uniref:hypothetical protein n=1 Tax=Mucilaginibacter sp. TaxID=1882438 RepID=UPI003265347A
MLNNIQTKGITAHKKTELDKLTIDVISAQQQVDQLQAIVNSLTGKADSYQGFLAVADSNKQQALSNKQVLDTLVQSALDLVNNSAIAIKEMGEAASSTTNLAAEMKLLIDKLIYTAEVTNKLANLVIRQKALNPLISDDLVSLVGTAGTDANNAVALTLVALQSSFAAAAAHTESAAATKLSDKHAAALYQTLTGMAPGKAAPKKETASLQSYLHTAYTNALAAYKHSQAALKNVTTQLNHAQADLNKAQVKLKSLQAGLAAANAAALAQ